MAQEKKQKEHLTDTLPIGVKAAVRIAARYLKEIVGAVEDVLVEEIEKDETNSRWVVTLGYSDRSSAFLPERKYKKFTINGTTGEVIAMQIRKT